MAKKQRAPPIEEPPTASSSSGEEDASSEEQKDQQLPTLSQSASKNASPHTPTNSHRKPSSSSSSSSSESGSDDESEPENSPPPANPKAKPKAQAQSSSVPARSALKRPVENNTTAHVNESHKRAKKKATDDEIEAEDDGKKSVDDSKKVFQRVWSEDDEVAIVKSLAEFGTDAVKDMNALYDYVKKSLHFDASRKQLSEKIRRLKEKFRANARKKDPTFSKPHEHKLFELSRNVWGNEEAKSPKKEASRRSAAVAASSKKQPPIRKPVPETGEEEPDSVPAVASKGSENVKSDNGSLILREMLRFDKAVGLNGLNEDVVKRGIELIGESNKVDLEVRWKKLHVTELELYVEHVQLIKDQTKLMLEAYK